MLLGANNVGIMHFRRLEYVDRFCDIYCRVFEDFLSLNTIQPGVDERKFYDKDFSFHKDFLQGIDDVLNKDGYLILYENKTQIPPELIMKTNPRLELIDYMEHIESRYTGVFKFT